MNTSPVPQLSDYTECPPSLLAHKMAASSAYHVYRATFQEATGLTLKLIGPAPEDDDGTEVSDSVLCRKLNLKPEFSCARCSLRQFHVEGDGADELVFGECRAGLHYLIATVRFAGIPVLQLEAGQFLLEAESRGSSASSKILSQAELKRASDLLRILAELIGGSVNAALLLDSPDEPAPILGAKALVRDHPSTVTLEEAAAAQGLPVAQFSLRFREVTGLSFTEFVERTRLEKARRFLLEGKQARMRGAWVLAGCMTQTELNQLFHRRLGQKVREYRLHMARTRRRLSECSKPVVFPLALVDRPA